MAGVPPPGAFPASQAHRSIARVFGKGSGGFRCQMSHNDGLSGSTGGAPAAGRNLPDWSARRLQLEYASCYPGKCQLPCSADQSGQATTRSASGTDRKVTHSRSPTYSPSTWNATGRLARIVSAASSCRRTMCRPCGGRSPADSIWRSARKVPIVRSLRSAKTSSPVSNPASGLVWTGLRPT